MQVKLIDHSGTDLTVVNAARVSFKKESREFSDRDAKLIRYLAEHNHWTPFAHTSITLYLKVPIFVARQVMKHQVGFVVNEVSRRYVDDEPEFYQPPHWRLRAENVKQGSSTETIPLDREAFDLMHEAVLTDYYDLLEQGVAPEMARMVLPLNTYTEFWMTGSLAAWARMVKLRLHPSSQVETQEVAQQISTLIEPLFPVAWHELTRTRT